MHRSRVVEHVGAASVAVVVAFIATSEVAVAHEAAAADFDSNEEQEESRRFLGCDVLTPYDVVGREG